MSNLTSVGSYGDIVFLVSPKTTQTFNNLERSGEARWIDHEIIGQKPKSEFTGMGLEVISFDILLKAELGINPVKQLEKFRAMRDNGKVAPFILGGKPISSNYWSIQNLRETHKAVDFKGNLLVAEVTIELKEYVIKKKSASKPTVKSVATKATSSISKKSLGKITMIVKSVNIRSGPSTSAKIVGCAYKGDVLTVYSVSNGWYSLGQGKYISANTAYSTLKKG